MTMNPIQVFAPATTANLGPGFDCLGMTLDIWNRLEVYADSREFGGHDIEIIGEGAGELEVGPGNLVYRAMQFLFREAGKEMPSVHLRCHNEIPLSRGMGSSAAAIALGLLAANTWCGRDFGSENNDGFSSNELLEMAATIEGHPDNVAAAMLGGLRLVVTEDDKIFTAPVSVPPGIRAVLFIPDYRIGTHDARSVVPQTFPRADAVYNMARASLLVAAMAGNHPEYLAQATKDRLHQPYRRELFPAMQLLFRAAMDAGALGVFLSGSGSTVLALTQGREMTVGYEMAEAAKQAGVEGRLKITQPSVRGAYVVED